MNLPRRLTLVDLALVMALFLTGALWIAERTGARTPAAEAGMTGVVDGAAAAFPDAPEIGPAMDAVVAAVLASDGPALGPALLDTVRAATNAGNLDAASAILAFANALTTDSDRAFDAAATALEALAVSDPIAGAFVRRFTAALLSNLFDYPAAPPAAGQEWVQLMVIGRMAPATGPATPGTATWSFAPGENGGTLTAAIAIPDADTTGTLTIARSAAFGTSLVIAATFDGPFTDAAIVTVHPVGVGNGTLAYDTDLSADVRTAGAWRIEAGLWSSDPANLTALRAAETISLTADLAGDASFLFRVVKGATGEAAFAEAWRAWGF